MIILVASEKGGAGKTTVATNLAAFLSSKGRDVLLLDTDIQGSSALWGGLRDDDGTKLTVFQKTGVINREVSKVVSKYDDIVIDAGGRDSEEMRSAMLNAHVWYIPVQPSQFDMWTISKMADLYNKVKALNPDLRAYILLNRASTHPNHNDYDEAHEALKEANISLPMSRCQLFERTAYKRAASMGLGVTELKRGDYDPKAAHEIAQIYEELLHG